MNTSSVLGPSFETKIPNIPFSSHIYGHREHRRTLCEIQYSLIDVDNFSNKPNEINNTKKPPPKNKRNTLSLGNLNQYTQGVLHLDILESFFHRLKFYNMPEHAAGDTSKFNELIPQALQQTLYTKILKCTKGKKKKHH